MSYRLFRSAIESAVVLVCLSGYAQAGLIEICKDDSPAGSLSGLSNFAIAGQAGTVAVPVGACSPAIQLPDGFATIRELPQPGTTLIGVFTFPNDRLISFDTTTASAVVLIVPGDISTQTVVTFTNAPISLVPEPGTRWLFGLGLTLWALRRKPLNRGIIVQTRNRLHVLRRARVETRDRPALPG
jgi:PEP-CTERM motif